MQENLSKTTHIFVESLKKDFVKANSFFIFGNNKPRG
jgi:hypothetical protein